MRVVPWVGLLALVAGVGTAADDKPAPVTPTAEWAGAVEAEGLEKIAPPVVTTAEGWGILWKAWKGADAAVPEVDFDDALVVVSTTRGSVLKASYRLTPGGDLTVLAAGTRDLRPGFRYALASVPRAGVVSVNGKPLPASEPLVPALPTGKPYAPAGEVAGSLKLVGSLTMSGLVGHWAAGFNRFHPKLTVATDFEGSEVGLGAMGADPLTVAAFSRPVDEAELKAAGEKLKAKLVAFPVCEDDVAVIVHKSNPVHTLSPDQLKQVYAPSADPLTWGALKLTGDWAAKPVTIHGRDEKSGTRQYLRTLAVGPSGAEPEQKTYGSYTEVVEAVAGDPTGIGYCRAGQVTPAVKPVRIGPTPSGAVVPYVRRSCVLVAVAPADGQPFPPAVKEFLTYAYRLDGLAAVVREGFTPLGKDVIGKQLDRLGVEDIR